MASSAGAPVGPAKRGGYIQRRMGPAPFASFEDLSDGLESPEEKPAAVARSLPGIREDVRMAADGAVMSPGSTASSSLAVVSLQTPSTPRIDISRASSSSHHDSNNSSPERELYAGTGEAGPTQNVAKLGLGFKEEGAADLRSSTEELDYHEEAGTVTEREAQRRRERLLKKKQQQAAILFKYELEAQSEKEGKERKDSSCSATSDAGFLSISGRTSRLSSIGSAASAGSGASAASHISHLSVVSGVSGLSAASSGRSPSPHKMLLETSFCGSKPILTQSVDIESPPGANKHETESLEKVLLSRHGDPTVAVIGGDILVQTQMKGTEGEHIFFGEKHERKVEESTVRGRVNIGRQTDRGHKERRNDFSKVVQEKKNENKDEEWIFLRGSDQDLSGTRTQEYSSESVREHTNLYFQGRKEEQHRRDFDSIERVNDEREPQKPVTLNLSESGKSVKPIQTFSQILQKDAIGSKPVDTRPLTPKIPEAVGSTPKSLSGTPTASPKLSRHAMLKKNDDGGSRTPSPSSASRKSSFTSLFKRNEGTVSVMSPESPTVPSGKRKSSGLTTILKEASEGLRDRSRSRSKSRERISSGITIASSESKVDAKGKKDSKNKSVFSSLFKKKEKKKGTKSSDSDVVSPIDLSSPETKLPVIETIGNVEFIFNSEGNYQPSEFGMIRGEGGDIQNSRSQSNTLNDVQELINQLQESLLPSESVMLPTLTQFYQESTPVDDKSATETLTPINNEIKKLSTRTRDASIVTEAAMTEHVSLVDNENLRIDGSNNTSNLAEDAEHHSSESERDSEIEYIRTKVAALKKQEGEVTAEDHERKGLVLQQDSFEDELPYIPTTLPQERSVALPIVPIKQRIAEVRTCPIERPRSTTPINPSLLEEYIHCNSNADDGYIGTKEQVLEKMRICLPREDSVTSKVKSPRRTTGTARSWFEFAEQGLQSPREYRKTSLTQGSDATFTSPSPPPPPLPPRAQATPPPPVTPPPKPTSWINFEEIPEKRKPPKRIQTIPSRGTLDLPETTKMHVESDTSARKSVIYSYVNPEDCKCECHESTSGYNRHTTTSMMNTAGGQMGNGRTSGFTHCSHHSIHNEHNHGREQVNTRLEVDTSADRHSYMSDSSYDYPNPYNLEHGVEYSEGLKPMKPFGMDLDVSSNRSSIISQDEPQSPEIGSPNSNEVHQQ